MSETIAVSAPLLRSLVGFIGKTGAFLERAAKERERVVAAAPEAVDLLVRKNLLSEIQKDAAVEAIDDSHAKTVELLRRTATHVPEEPVPMGEPVKAGLAKSAGAGGNGETRKERLEAADRRFLEALGF